MRRLLSISFILALPFVLGCGNGQVPPDKVYRPDLLQGQVDASLPAPLQAKQQALRRLLAGLQEGIGDSHALREFVPGITFRESFDRFYEGAERLARWEFNGAPKNNEVPVALYLVDTPDGGAKAERRVERVYLVSGGGRQFTVARK